MPGAADLLIEQIGVLQGSGQFDAAAAAIATLAEQHPHHLKLPSLQGELASARGDHAAAAASYAEMLRAQPRNVTCRARLARSLKQLDRHREALAVLAEGLSLMPEAEALLIEQIGVLQRSGQLDAAEAAIVALAKQHPDHLKLPQLRGELADALGDLKVAAEIYAEAVRAQPRDVTCRARLASRLKQLGRYDEAVAVLAEGLSLMPGAADLLIEQIGVLQGAGQFDAAAAAIATLAEQHPHHLKLPSLQGELASARGDHAAAAASYAKMLRAQPRNVTCRARLARSLKQLDRHREALAVLAEGLSLMPEAEALLIEQIGVLQRSGQLDAAEAAIVALAKQHPDHLKLPQLRGELADALGDLKVAAEIYAEAVRAQPRDVTCRARLASRLKQLGRYDEAVAVLAEGLSLMPGAADLLIEQIGLLQSAGQFDAAAAAIATLAEQHPHHLKLPSLQGELASARGDHAAAAASYAKMLRAQPRNVTCRARLARSLKQLDRHREALAVLAEGLSLMPGAEALLIEQIGVLQRSGQLDAAEAAIVALAKQHPDHLKLPQLRGELADALGDLKVAAEIYAEAVRAQPRDVTCRARLASRLKQLGRYDEAVAVLAEGLSLMPGAADLLIEQIGLLQGSGQFDAAAAAIAALAEQHPHHLKLPQLSGELADASGDSWTALEIFQADLARYPRDVARRLRVAKRLQLAGLALEALELIGEPRSATLVERVARVGALMQLGRWDDVAKELHRWPTDGPRAKTARVKSEMQLALLTFDLAVARSHAEHLLAENPGDLAAAQALVQSATLTFDVNTAWSALSNIPTPAVGGGPARIGGRRRRHLFGRLVDEFRLQPQETQILAGAAGLSGEMQARKAAELLQEDSSNSAAALAFLIGMARAGRLDGSIAASSSQRQIPQKLHQYWDRDPAADIERLMNKTAEVNPRYAYRRWDDVAARRYLAALDRPRLLRAYREAKHVAIRADIFRLALLFAEGGVYMDADDLCTRPIEALLPAEAEAVFYQEYVGSIGNNFLAAAPGNRLIGAALDEAVQAVLQGAGESPWLATGPGLLSRIVAAALARDPALRLPKDIKIIPLGVFRETVQASRGAAYKRGAQHWARAG